MFFFCHDNLRIVDKNVDVPPLLGQVAHDALYFGRVANIKLEWKNLNAITNLAFDLLGELPEGVSTTGCENETQIILGRSPGEFEGSGTADAGGGAGDKDSLAS